jgi:hypothetical protein
MALPPCSIAGKAPIPSFGRVGKHRLMDCNNHPDTALAEVHSLPRMHKHI